MNVRRLKFFPSEDFLKAAAPWGGLLFLVGALVFSLAQFLEGRSLWLDEAFLAVNIKNRDFWQLFTPLEYGQQFPRGYLALVWVLTEIIGYHVWVLRLLPFLFGVGALFLWCHLLWVEFENGPASIQFTALVFFLLNHVYFQYVGDFKQYTGDYFWAAWAVFAALHAASQPQRFSRPGWIIFSICAGLPVLFSNTYILVLVSASASLLLLSPPTARYFGLLAGPFLSIVFFFSLSWLIDLRHVPDSMLSYWENFFITGNRPVLWIHSFTEANARLLGDWLLARFRWIFVGLAWLGFLGTVILKKKKETSPLILTAGILLLMLLALAALKIYPADGERLVLFFYPFAVALIFKGIRLLMEDAWTPARWGAGVFLAILLGWLVFRKTPELTRHVFFKEHWENINPALKMMDPNISPYVVYPPGTAAQVAALPQKPRGLTFIYLEDLDLSQAPNKTGNGWIDGSFYYLMAYPSAEHEELEARLEDVSPHKVEQIQKHLFFFEPASPKN